MNSLHTVIEMMRSTSIPFVGSDHSVVNDIMSKVLPRVRSTFLDLATEAIAFDMGEPDDTIDFDASLCRMPYEVMWLEGKNTEDSKVGALLCISGHETGDFEGVIQTLLFYRGAGQWAFLGFVIANPNDLEGAIYSSVDAEVTDALSKLWSRCFRFLCAINCCNVTQFEEPAPYKLQRARIRRGKQPLFSTWTLRIGDERPSNSPALGGTHASPRVHLRRGHFRRISEGRTIWVQAHVVGSKEAGMVHKDYAWKGGTAA